MGKPTDPGDIVRYEEPSRPLHAAIVITLLTFFELVLVVLVVLTLFMGMDSTTDQILQAQWLFGIFMILGIILMLYRRYFVPDVLIVKVRNKKYEDFIDQTRIPKEAR